MSNPTALEKLYNEFSEYCEGDNFVIPASAFQERFKRAKLREAQQRADSFHFGFNAAINTLQQTSERLSDPLLQMLTQQIKGGEQ